MLSTAADHPRRVSDEEAVAAVEYLDTTIGHLRDQTRQADAKASMVLTVVGLILAVATAVLPRLDDNALVLAAIALGLVVISGPVLGAAIVPRSEQKRRRRRKPTSEELVGIALERVREPHALMERRAEEVCTLIAVSNLKHGLVRGALLLLCAAFVLATAAAAVLAVNALT